MNIIEKKAVGENIRLEEWYESTSSRLPLDDDVIVKTDIPYINDKNERHTFDVYYQGNATKKPVIFDFHGGGFISGNKKYNKWFGEKMAKHGFLVFVIGYPLTFERKLYDILKDCYEGIKVAYSMVEEFGGDKDNIFLCGDSAGGFLATYLAAINNDSKIAQSVGVQQANITIKALGAISALFYCSKIDKNGLFVMRSTLFGKQYRKHPFWKYVNPEKDVYKALPPVFAITSKGDFLQSYTLDFVRYLNKKEKTACVFSCDNKNLEHDFVCLNPDYEETADALKRMSDFFKKMCN